MFFKKAQTDANSQRPKWGKFRKILKIVLIILICLLGLVAIRNSIHAYNVSKLAPKLLADSGVSSQLIRHAVDTLLISTAVKNFQLLNDGAFPTVAEITAETSTEEAPLLLYNEEAMEIKTSSDVPAGGLDEVDFPDIGSVHIWPGYVCLSNGEETGFLGQKYPNYSYNPESNSYTDAITPGNPQDFAIVAQVDKLLVPQSIPDNSNTIKCSGTNLD